MDVYAVQNPLPTVDVIFTAMTALEERWNTLDDGEIWKASYAGQRGRRGSGGSYKPKANGSPRHPSGSDSKICYSCGKSGHLAQECSVKEKMGNVCKAKFNVLLYHLQHMAHERHYLRNVV